MSEDGLLAKEVEVFERFRREWCKSHQGKFVVIQDETVIDEFFDEWEDAFKAGIKRFGSKRNFLVKQIWVVEPVYCL